MASAIVRYDIADGGGATIALDEPEPEPVWDGR